MVSLVPTPASGTLTPATNVGEMEFVDIDTIGKLDLPSLPILKQEKDWKQWWNSVNAYFEVLELEKFLTTDIQEPIEPDNKKKWQKCRRFVMVHLLKAISAGVQKDMEVLGWDIKNPYNTIEMAKRAVTQVSGDSLRQLLDSWNRLNARGYRNLKDFIQHVQQLRDTLQQHGHNIEDNTAILNVLTAIESVDPAWVHLLEHDYTCGNLPWSKLTSLCMAKGNIQLTRSAFASIVDSDDSSLPQAKYDAQIKCEGCGREGYAKKDCWNCIRGPPRGGYRGRGRGMSRGRGAGRGRGGQRLDESKPFEMDATSTQPFPPPFSQQPQQPQ